MQDPTFICQQGCSTRSTPVAIPEDEREQHAAWHDDAEHEDYDGPSDEERERAEERHDMTVQRHREQLIEAGHGHKIRGLLP